MSRRIVSYTPSGAYTFRNVNKTTSNDPKVILGQGEQTSVLFDLTAYLEAGETITAATSSGSGISPTLTIETGDTKVTASNLTPANGYADLTFTTSSGEKITTRLFVAERSRPYRSDYSGVAY